MDKPFFFQIYFDTKKLLFVSGDNSSCAMARKKLKLVNVPCRNLWQCYKGCGLAHKYPINYSPNWDTGRVLCAALTQIEVSHYTWSPQIPLFFLPLPTLPSGTSICAVRHVKIDVEVRNYKCFRCWLPLKKKCMKIYSLTVLMRQRASLFSQVQLKWLKVPVNDGVLKRVEPGIDRWAQSRYSTGKLAEEMMHLESLNVTGGAGRHLSLIINADLDVSGCEGNSPRLLTPHFLPPMWFSHCFVRHSVGLFPHREPLTFATLSLITLKHSIMYDVAGR